MKEATGSTISFFFIMIGIVVTMGYLAFNINYTKAFRMKDKIIAVYDDHNGKCENVSACENEIKEYARSIGYNTDNTINCSGYNEASSGLYCYSKEEAYKDERSESFDDRTPTYYYKISTKIYLEIPIISNILNFKVFYITGNTKTYVDAPAKSEE